jgi:hypothetical protein
LEEEATGLSGLEIITEKEEGVKDDVLGNQSAQETVLLFTEF